MALVCVCVQDALQLDSKGGDDGDSGELGSDMDDLDDYLTQLDAGEGGTGRQACCTHNQ
jgi:hypothetical protein